MATEKTAPPPFPDNLEGAAREDEDRGKLVSEQARERAGEVNQVGNSQLVNRLVTPTILGKGLSTLTDLTDNENIRA